MSFHRLLSTAVLLAASAAALAADRTPDARVEHGGPPSPLAAQPLDRLSATRERPLFSPTRRPPPPPPVVVNRPAPPPPPPPPPSVALFGIVMDGDEARAIVRTGPGAGVIRVRIGDDIGGWTVTRIEGRHLVLALDDRTATFTMFAGGSTNGVPHAGPDAPPATSQNAQDPSSSQKQPQSEPARPGVPAPRKSRRAKS